MGLSDVVFSDTRECYGDKVKFTFIRMFYKQLFLHPKKVTDHAKTVLNLIGRPLMFAQGKEL